MARNLGRLDEAVTLERRAAELDPMSATRFHNLGFALFIAGQHDESEAALKRALELSPSRVMTWTALALTHIGQERPQDALEAADRETFPEVRVFGLSMAHYALGNVEESDKQLQWLVENDAEAGSFQIAQAYAYRGDVDAAFEWLEHSYRAKDSALASVMTDPLLVSLNDDPRWDALLQKLGLKLTDS